MNTIQLCKIEELKDRIPVLHKNINGLDLVIIKYDTEISVFYGRCFVAPWSTDGRWSC